MSPIQALGASPMAAMTFDEIASAMGTSKQNVVGVYVRAMRKLRRRGPQLRVMASLAAELERGRPVDLDLFGDDDDESKGANIARRSPVPEKVPGVRQTGARQPQPLLQRRLPHEGLSQRQRAHGAQVPALRQVHPQTRPSCEEVRGAR